MIFCTLFNRTYLPQGLALYRSLKRTCASEFVLYVLCMDDFTAEALTQLDLRGVKIVLLSQIEDDALKSVKSSRTIGEYCWTCTTPLLLHVLDLHPSDAIVTYVDADLWFFSDPSVIVQEIGSRSILIHEHDFAPEHAHLQPAAGRFNVGLVSFRNNEEGRTCLERWKKQCIDECVMDPAAGKCGDQIYLEEWPVLYPGLAICQNPGIGLGPWNISKHRLKRSRRVTTVDDRPIVFYHFHSMRLLRPRFRFRLLLMAMGAYRFSDNVVELIYRPYAAEVWRAFATLSSKKLLFAYDFSTLPSIQNQFRNYQMICSFLGVPISRDRNGQLIELIYGVDAVADER